MTFRQRLDDNRNPAILPILNVARKVAIGATSATSPVITSAGVRMTNTVECFITIGPSVMEEETETAPVAADTDHYLEVGRHDIEVTPGHKIAVIRAGSTDGVLYLSEVI